MKKFAASLITACLLANLVGCGNQETPASTTADNGTTGITSTAGETSCAASGYYVDESGDIIDASTGEKKGNVKVDEETGDIIDISTGEVIQSKEESDKIKEGIRKSTTPPISSPSSKPSSGNTAKPTAPPANNTGSNSKPTTPPKDSTPPASTPDDPKHTHKFEYYYTKVEATCNKDGIDLEKCFDCGETREVPNKNRYPHNFPEGWVITKYPTPTSTGIQERVCSYCGTKETETIPKVTLKHQPTDFEYKMLEFINASRKEAGVAPLEFNYMYYDCAYIRGQEIKQVYSHDRPNGESFMTVLTDNGFSIPSRIGENIQRGENYGTEGAHLIFMDSPGHKENILWEEYTSVSIRVLIDELTNKYYVVENFFG